MADAGSKRNYVVKRTELSAELEKKLEELKVKPLKDEKPIELGAEKRIFRSHDGEKVIVCAQKWVPKTEQGEEGTCSWNYQRELEVLQKLQEEEQQEVHSHFVRMLEFFETPETGPCMIMELVKPLGKHVLNIVNYYHYVHKKEVPFILALHILEQLCQALRHLHTKVHCVHADVKSENVLVTVSDNSKYHVKLCDFGGVKELPFEGKPGERYHKGKKRVPEEHWPKYYPPEFFGNPRIVDPRTDVWGLGLILFDCFEGGARMNQKWRDVCSKTLPEQKKRLPGDQWCFYGVHPKQPTDIFFLDKPETCPNCEVEQPAGHYMHKCYTCKVNLCEGCVETWPKGQQKCKKNGHEEDNQMFVILDQMPIPPVGVPWRCQGDACNNIVDSMDEMPYMHFCTKCNKYLCVKCVERPARKEGILQAYTNMLRPLGARWELSNVENWIEEEKKKMPQKNKTDGHESILVWPRDQQIDHKSTSRHLSKADVDCVGGFALRVGPSMAGKCLGPTQKSKDEKGNDIKVIGLDLGKKGVHVMCIERADETQVDMQPQAHHELKEGDVIYVGFEKHVCSTVLDFEAVPEYPEQKAFPFFHEWDKFDLPPEFAGYVLGPPTETHKYGLDLRNKERFSVNGIIRKESKDGTSPQKVIFPAHAALELEAGDCALVFRLPDLSTSCSRSMDIDRKIDDLLKKASHMRKHGQLSPKGELAVNEGNASGYPRHAEPGSD